MRPALAASAVVAALVHGCVLFGLDLDRTAAPLPSTAGAIVVSLVAAAPAPRVESPAAVPAPPPPPEPPRAKRIRKPEPTRPRVAAKPVPSPAPAAAPPVLESEPARGAATDGAGAGPSAVRGAADGAPNGATQIAALRIAPVPEYPASAKRLRQEGVVLLVVEVSAGGRPLAVSVARSSGVASLDEAAVRGVRRWRFDPARTAGLPVASRVEVPIRFSLSD